jgi:hypothetical protein
MKHARFFFILVAFMLMAYGMVGFYFLPFADFEGDLTRMAKLPESDFGWTQAQPAVDSRLMQSSGWEDADVVAIGDSFTDAQLWQSELARRGLRVHTENWAKMNGICADLGSWIHSKGFKGRHIIIESAEKYLEVRLQESIACKQTIYHPLREWQAQPPPTIPERSHGYGGSMSVGIQTALNQYKLWQKSTQPGFSRWDGLGEVSLVRLADGCKLFSHPHCRDVLFYKKDRVDDMGENVLNNMAVINARLADFDVVWMVIPDKASVYLPNNKKFWDEAERRFNAPNLLKVLQEARYKTMDLYLANNTHVSTRGYLLLGDVMFHRLQ